MAAQYSEIFLNEAKARFTQLVRKREGFDMSLSVVLVRFKLEEIGRHEAHRSADSTDLLSFDDFSASSPANKSPSDPFDPLNQPPPPLGPQQQVNSSPSMSPYGVVPPRANSSPVSFFYIIHREAAASSSRLTHLRCSVAAATRRRSQAACLGPTPHPLTTRSSRITTPNSSNT